MCSSTLLSKCTLLEDEVYVAVYASVHSEKLCHRLKIFIVFFCKMSYLSHTTFDFSILVFSHYRYFILSTNITVRKYEFTVKMSVYLFCHFE